MNKIYIEKIVKSYKSKQILHISEIEIAIGVTSILGKNGSGKSTFVKALAGLIDSEISFAYCGKTFDQKSKLWHSKIGYLPQDVHLYEDMTVYRFCEYMLILSNWQGSFEIQIKKHLNCFNLSDKINDTICTLSGGMRQRLAIIQSMIHEPEIIILDEPCNHLDFDERRRFHFILQSLSEKKIILYIGHEINEIFDLSQKLLILNQGKIAYFGAKHEINNFLKYSIIEEIWPKPIEIEKLNHKGLIKLSDEGDHYIAKIAVRGKNHEILNFSEIYQLFIKSISQDFENKIDSI